MKKLFLFAVSVAATASAVLAVERPEVLCIYYPEWHVYPEWEAHYGKGTTEWSCVTNARPRFPGHYQPIVPLMGYYDESKPETAAKEIDLAADAGIDVFIYDWYWANKKPIQHEGLENGILKAPNRDRIKFAVMWAYHDRDVPFQSAFGEEKKHYLWKLERTPEDFLEAFEYCAKKYFTEPTYWRKDGHPFFSMYACDSFVKDMGGPEKTKAVLERAQAIVKAMGLPSVHFNAMVYNADYSKASIAAGFHSTTVYSMHGYHYKKGEKMELAREFIMEYADLMKAMVDVNSALAKVSPMHIPLVQRGWDCTPRCDPKEPFPWRKSHYPYMGIYANVTPAKFEAALRSIKALALADPKKPGAVLINAWNEYTEGAWLVPDTRDGDAYLRAVERVFGRRK